MLPAFRHEARPYGGTDGFTSSCVELVRSALDRDERILVLAGSDRFDDVRDGLGPLADDVTFVPTDEHGRNPARLTTLLHNFGSGGDSGRRSLGVTEAVVPGRTEAELSELLLAESLLNSMALKPLPMSVHCLYDLDELDDPGVQGMCRCHPVVHGADDNPDFDEALATALHGTELVAAPESAERLVAKPGELAGARAFVRAAVSGQGLPADRADDLVLAANELIVNSLRHGGGRADIRVWTEHRSVVCEVRDHGYLRDPMIGRLAPGADATSGRGLWLVHHLCDLVQLRSSERFGTVVRVFVDR